YGLMVVSWFVLWLALKLTDHLRWLPEPSSIRELRLSSNPVLLMLPMFVVMAEERLPAGAGIRKMRRSVFLLYQSTEPVKRCPNNPKSKPPLVVRVSSQRMLGSTPVGRSVETNSFPNCACVCASPSVYVAAQR